MTGFVISTFVAALSVKTENIYIIYITGKENVAADFLSSENKDDATSENYKGDLLCPTLHTIEQEPLDV